MAEIDVEPKNNGEYDKNKNRKWWVLLVLVIIGTIVLWYAFSDTTNVEPEDGPDLEDNPHIEEPISSAATAALPFSKTRDQLEPIN